MNIVVKVSKLLTVLNNS